ncbi:hypothetical protein, partial [Enterococcus faecium]|uniref:hypothetical protein n=1 Tax=Enterococcus faecium TaxID=1352 RepID=UPI003DA0FC1F
RAFGPRTGLAVALCASGLVAGHPVLAQSATPADARTLDTVVVTASGYEQQIQDAPATAAGLPNNWPSAPRRVGDGAAAGAG